MQITVPVIRGGRRTPTKQLGEVTYTEIQGSFEGQEMRLRYFEILVDEVSRENVKSDSRLVVLLLKPG